MKVIITGFQQAQKITTIQELRNIFRFLNGGTGLGLTEAKKIVDTLPVLSALLDVPDSKMFEVEQSLLKAEITFDKFDDATLSPVPIVNSSLPNATARDISIASLCVYARELLNAGKFSAATSVCNLLSILEGIDKPA